MAFTSAQIITRLRAEGISTSDISDANLTELISGVKEKFDTYKPLVGYSVSGIVTVANQSDYSYPSGALRIKDVLWFPNLSAASVQSFLNEILLGINEGTGVFDYPSLSEIWSVKYNQFNEHYGGSWTEYSVSSVPKIHLDPQPDTAGINVPVIFYIAHNADLSTIPDYDKELFLEGIRIYSYNSIAKSQQKTGGFKAGSYTKLASSGDSLASGTMNEYSSWIMRMSANAAVARG